MRQSMKDSHFLLDTNCFYELSGKKELLDLFKKHRENLHFSILNVIEILSIKQEKDFNKRRGAIIALDYIKPRLVPIDPYLAVIKAFGEKLPYEITFRQVQTMIETLKFATSFKAYAKGYFYRGNNTYYPSIAEKTLNWKNQPRDEFKEMVLSSTVDAPSKFVLHYNQNFPEESQSLIEEFGVKKAEKKIRKEVKNQISEMRLDIRGKDLLMPSFAAQAGIINSSELKDIVEKKDIVSFYRLVDVARSNYNMTLEVFFEVYNYYMSNKLLQSGGPERNDFFDLEFFKLLDATEFPLIFVTLEHKWLNDGFPENVKNRVKHFRALETELSLL